MLFDSGQQYGGRAYRDCIASARAHKIPIVIARGGMRWTSADDVELDVLAPSIPRLAETGDDVNENSIVAMVHYHEFRELFMGDAGEANEERLLSAGYNLQADVVKVGHHGSAYASTSAFVSRVRPAYAVISVGRHNTFGHPAATTLQTWEQSGARVLRTDECGAVTIRVEDEPHSTIACEVLTR